MEQDLFKLTPKEYKLERRVWEVNQKIKNITLGLGIKTDHDETGHYYVFNGVRYPSVTGRLAILKDPSLANWKMNRALDYMYQHFPEITPDNIMEHLEKAKLLPQTEFENAGSIGTKIHDWREKYFAQLMAGSTAPFEINKDDLPEIISGSRAIQKFHDDTGYIPVACELYLADEKLKVGGTADDIGFLNGELGFMDVKSSNIGDKDAYFYQVALYVYMFEKLYKIRTKWHKILHVSKTDGTYKLIDIPDIRKRIKEAKQIIKVDQFLQELKQEKKKIPIKI